MFSMVFSFFIFVIFYDKFIQITLKIIIFIEILTDFFDDFGRQTDERETKIDEDRRREAKRDEDRRR